MNTSLASRLDAPTTHFINDENGVKLVLDALGPLTSDTPKMYISLEGSHVSRQGYISLLTIYFEPVNPRSSHLVYIVDVHRLQARAFTTANGSGHTLKQVLESEQRTKIFFNMLNASHALFSHFGIQLQGILDLQLMEGVSRRYDQDLGRFLLRDLRQCIAQDARLPLEAFAGWMNGTDDGGILFRSEQGGSNDVLNERPLLYPLFAYCVAQVRYLPRLEDAYWRRLDAETRTLVRTETGRRVLVSQGQWFNPFTEKHMLSPFLRSFMPYFF